MPTLNNDLPVVTENPIEDHAAQRSRRIIGASLGATLLTVLILFAAMALAPVDASAANTCTLTSSAPTTNWSDTTKWSGCAGGYPGQSASGDTAIVTLGGFTLNVDTAVNPVSLQLSGSGGSDPVTVSNGATLTLQSSSTATSSNSFTVASGGTLGVDLAANLSGWQSPTTINGGTFNVAGSITFINGAQLTFKGGTIQGGGTITIPNTQAASFTGATSAMVLTGGTVVEDFGSVTLTSAANALSINNGAKIKIESTGAFGLSSDATINTDNVASPLINNLGTLAKTGGSDSIINVAVNNSNSVSASVGQLELNGGGTHSGSFVTSSTAPIVFSGNHTFNSGSSFSGTFPIKIGGGTQTFNASINASSGLKWAGGTIAGTGPLNVSSGLLFDGSLSAMTLTGVVKSTAAISYAPSSNLLTINGASAMLEIASPGSLSIAGDYDIKAVPSGAGKLRISGGASVTKTAGTTGSSILAYVDNVSSTLSNSSAAPLNLGGGGQSTGTVNASAASSILNIAGGTFDSSGAFSGSGTINVAGGTLNVNTATTFGSSTPNLGSINAGTLGGTGSVILLGSTTWSGGTITGSSSLTVSPATGVLTLTGANGPMTLDGRTITNNSTLTYNSSSNNLTIKNSGAITSSATFNATGAGTIANDGTPSTVTSSGQFNKTASGLFIIEPTFNVSGTGVAITGGVLDIDSTGTSSAPWTMSAGTEVWFPTPFAGTYTWASGTSFAGGKVTIDGSGTVATSFAMTINNTNLEVNGGTFSTPNTFTVTSPATLKWKGGTLSGAGHTVISAGTTFDMTTENASRSVSGHTIDNGGNATMVSLTQQISLDSGSAFNNTGNLDIQNDGALLTNASGSNTFSNSGNVKKTVGGSGFRFDVPYNQTSVGTTDANSATSGSTIIFNNGGSMSGGALKATSSTNFVDFFNGTFTVSGGSFNSGAPGAVRINGSGATLIVNAAISTTNFVQNSGKLSGSANLTVPSGGTFTWNGGTLDTGAGQLVVASGGILDVAGANNTPLVLNSHTINNTGTITYHPLSGGQSNQLTLQGSASIANQSGALINVTDNSNVLQSSGSTTIVNSGNLLTSGSSSIAPAVTNNASGLIKPSGGTLTLFSGSSIGTLDAVSPGAINFGVGSAFTIAGGTWGGSGGGFWVTGGDVTFSANFSLSGLALNSGQIDGSSPFVLTLTGSNAWGGGTMAGTGTTTNSGTLTMSNVSNTFLTTRTFNNNGTLRYQGCCGSLTIGGPFNNNGLFDFQTDNTLFGTVVFHNNAGGTFQKSGGTSSSSTSWGPFNNDGTVAANVGTIYLANDGTHNGSFTTVAGSTISFEDSQTFNAASSLTGAGQFSFFPGTGPVNAATINSGTVNVGELDLFGINTVTLNTPATVGTFHEDSGTLNGTGALTITNFGTWWGGTITGTGQLTVNSGAGFYFHGSNLPMTLDGRQFVNNGFINFDATVNGLTMANGAVITNASGAFMDFSGTQSIAVSGSGAAITNSGTLERLVAGAIGIAPPVTNAGSIIVNTGQLAFNGGFSQSAGSTKLNAGTISSPSAIALAGGTLIGTGTVSAPLNNSNGTIAPGSPSTPGILTITGAYSQGSGGSMNVKIGGLSNFDVVDASSSALTLAGTLNATLYNGFTPSAGNTFDVLKFASRSGDFGTYNLPTFPGGGSFTSGYVSGTPNILRLSAVVTSADLLINQNAPSSVLHNQSGTWVLTVTNGPTPVTNVVVTDNFANASFLSVTGPCTPSGSTVTCNFGSLGANQSVSVSLILFANTLGTISNSASVTATEFDPNTANNNVGPASTTVLPAADLSLTNTASSNPVNAGASLSFTVNVSNGGPDATSGTVTISNTFPVGVTSFSFSGAGWSCGSLAGSVATCTNGASITSSGSAPPLILSMTAPGSGPAVDSATVSASTGDPSNGNNTASQSVTITPQADLSITKTGPASSSAGLSLNYTITVMNNGPSDATAVVVADPTPAGATFVSNSGACTTAFPCNLGTIIAGQSKTITSTFTTPPSFTGTSITNSATVTSATTDPSAGNNSATATTPFGPPTADLLVVKTGPASATPGSTITYTETISNSGPATATGVMVTDPTPSGLSFVSNSGGCTNAFPCSIGTLASGQSIAITSTYTVSATSGSVTNTAFVSGTSTDTNPANDSSNVITQIGTNVCGQQPPTLVTPTNGSTVSSPVTFTWTAVPGATSYKVFASVGGASTQEIGNTSATSLTVAVGGGTVVWSVQALGVANCNQLQSANGTFNVCVAGTAPVLSVVGTSSAGQSYSVQWTDVGVSTYELQESSTDSFDNAQTFQVTGTSKAFTKSAITPTAFFYRVRALSACGQGPGPYSTSERVVIVPIPPISSQGPSATVDINNKHVVVQTVFIPGQGSAIPFSATTDEPWLTVSPSSGILPAAGLTLTVSADPADLPNGTFTATIIVTFPGSPSKTGALDTKPPVSVPVSISVVTPVSPVSQSTPSANSLIIPSVGHLDGINSQWRSDVRITNTAAQKINYLLRFTPAGDATQVKQTQISIASNDTMALDDIVKNWYGVGALGDAANGVLEVRPLNFSGKGAPGADDVSVSFATIASSRTFNQSAGGTLGQFIPAIPFASFIGKVTGDARAGILSMQQIAQSSAYRTNLGIVEASGKPASVLVSVFDTSGTKLLDLPVDLKAGEQQQLNSFLAANNITLNDGRVEVKVTAGDGKVMAYASVVDNITTDPLLVTGTPLLQTLAHNFVIPGVADLNTGGANWRSDLRIFNAGTDPQYITMTLYPQTGSSSTDTIQRSFTVNPGEVSVLDNVLASKFGVTNIGGAMHVDTLADANLFVTGRTYNQVTGGGTYGQFIAAVTPNDGIGKGGRPLNVLQVEDSTRYRTNLWDPLESTCRHASLSIL